MKNDICQTSNIIVLPIKIVPAQTNVHSREGNYFTTSRINFKVLESLGSSNGTLESSACTSWHISLYILPHEWWTVIFNLISICLDFDGFGFTTLNQKVL